MKGIQEISLSEASVSEAMEDYLNKHLMPTSAVKVTKWEKKEAYDERITVTFEQPESASNT